jgi:hypothetical protein
LPHGFGTVTFDDYAWWVEIGLSLLFATLVARVAARKGRHPFAAALLVLAFANGWPLVWSEIGRAIATGFHVNDAARAMMARIFGYGGLMFGVVLSWIFVGCWKPRRTLNPGKPP